MADKKFCPKCTTWVEEPSVNVSGPEWVRFHTGRCPKCESPISEQQPKGVDVSARPTSDERKAEGFFKRFFRGGYQQGKLDNNEKVCKKCGITLNARLERWRDPTPPAIEKIGDEQGSFMFCTHCKVYICGGCSIDLGMSAGCPYCETELVYLDGNRQSSPEPNTTAQTREERVGIGGFFEQFRRKPKSTSLPNSSPNGDSNMGNLNPSSTDAFFHIDELVFKCPTCSGEVITSLHQIDIVNGINVVCPKCRNVAHVPGAYRTNTKPVGLKITGGVPVVITKFSEWWASHPLVNVLAKSRQLDLLYDYGLWAFCPNCYHQYPATVLIYLSVGQNVGGFIFTARTNKSGKDMESLLSGHCPSCGHNKLTVIITDIPDYVHPNIATKSLNSKPVTTPNVSEPPGKDVSVNDNIPYTGKKVAVKGIYNPSDPEMNEFWKAEGIRETAEGLGIITSGGVTYIISKGTTVPTTHTQICSTRADNQTAVEIEVVAGSSDLVNECRRLFKVTLAGIRKAPKGVPQIEVKFHINNEGAVGFRAKDLASGTAITANIRQK